MKRNDKSSADVEMLLINNMGAVKIYINSWNSLYKLLRRSDWVMAHRFGPHSDEIIATSLTNF